VKPVVCIRHEPSDDLGIARDLLEESGVPVEVVDAWDPRASWPSLRDLSGLVVFGGSMNVDEGGRHPFLLRTRALVADAVGSGTPMLGICLGAQALTRATGAPVVESPVVEIGFLPLVLTPEGEADRLLSAFSTGDLVFQWHRDACVLPPGAALLATGAGVPVQAFRVGPRAWGVQFHPEVTAEEVEAWVALEGERFQAVCRRAEDVREEIAIHLRHQQERARDLFHGFATVARERD
jgi:GMP synthase (glutamine-hydrolysing)